MRTLLLSMLLWTGCAPAVSEQNRAAAKVTYDIGVETFSRGDVRGALRELLQAVKLDPSLPQAQHALGLVFHAMGRFDDAKSHYDEALRLNPKFSEAYNNRGILFIDLNRYDDAIADFSQALADILYTTPALAEGNMGWAYYKKGDTAKAIQHISNAITTSPQFCRGYEWLARIGLEQHDASQVLTNAQRFEKNCATHQDLAGTLPDDFLRQMRYYLALGHLQQGNKQAAKEALKSCAVADAYAGFGQKCAQSLKTLQ